MDLKRLALAFDVSVFCTVLGFGLKTTLADLLSLWRRPALLARSLVAVFVVMPVAAVLLALMFDFRPTVEIALIALALSPVPPKLPKRQISGGGDTRYALGLMAALSLLVIVVAPLELEILERVFGRPLGMAPAAVARVVLVAAFLPLAAGMAMRALFPRLAASIERPAALTATILLPVGVLGILGSAAPGILALIGNGTIVAFALFLAVGLLVGHRLGGRDRDHSVVLALSTACRHPGVATAIAAANVTDERFGAALVLYLLLSVIVGIAFVRCKNDGARKHRCRCERSHRTLGVLLDRCRRRE